MNGNTIRVEYMYILEPAGVSPRISIAGSTLVFRIIEPATNLANVHSILSYYSLVCGKNQINDFLVSEMM